MNREESRGQTLVLFALFLTALLGGAAFVVDIGSTWSQGRDQQKAADAAALAGATAETNGGTQAQIIAAAVASATRNGFDPSEVTVNIPPASGAFAPGGSQSGPLSTNDCSSSDQYPCWVEVLLSKPHQNAFAGMPPFNQPYWNVSTRGVAVGGIANTVVNGVSPIMFSYQALQSDHAYTDFTYCDQQTVHCSPAHGADDGSWPHDATQFNWTTFCEGHPDSCNLSVPDARDIINGGGIQVPVYLGMYLGPHNQGNPQTICQALRDMYPAGADVPVAIGDDNGQLVGFWVWHYTGATGTDCTGATTITGHFVEDITASLPLSIGATGSAATFGQYVIRLVE